MEFGLTFFELLQLYKVMNHSVQLIQRKKMGSPKWNIVGGEKKNEEAVAITKEIQELLKPGNGKIGIAYNFIDAQVSFTPGHSEPVGQCQSSPD